MPRNLVFLSIISSAFLSCNREQSVSVVALCERDEIGNYVIKWEAPQRDGEQMKLFSSSSPDDFEGKFPVSYTDINQGITTYITEDNISHRYFLLQFYDDLKIKLGAREIQTDGVQNFRDIGGYNNEDNKTIKWGKVFRTGAWDNINGWDSLRISNLNINTLIDIRESSESELSPIKSGDIFTINIPIPSKTIKNILPKIKRGTMKTGDVNLLKQDSYIEYVDFYSEEIQLMLEYFLEESNYPIALCSELGRQRVGFVILLLMNILDIPEETILQDFLLSDLYVDEAQLAYLVKNDNAEVQEIFTKFLSTEEETFYFALRHIHRKYGSVDNYIANVLHITSQKKNIIKSIMLE